MRRYGWISFWVQLTLSVVSAVILLFSVAFTSQVRGVVQWTLLVPFWLLGGCLTHTPVHTPHAPGLIHTPLWGGLVRLTCTLAGAAQAVAPLILSPTSHLQNGPRASLYLTLVGILAGFLSTFWNFGYTRTAIKMQQYLNGTVEGAPKVKKQNVSAMGELGGQGASKVEEAEGEGSPGGRGAGGGGRGRGRRSRS